MGEILAKEDKPIVGTRNIIRFSARFGLIDNPERWLEFADHKNRTSHLYLEAVAKLVAESIRIDFLSQVEELLSKARKYI